MASFNYKRILNNIKSMNSLKTGIITDLRMLKHKSKLKHPECPGRLKAILKYLEQKKYLTHQRINYIPSYERFVDDQTLRLICPEQYITYLKELWPKISGKQSMHSDSYFNEHSQQIARLSAGGVLDGIDHIMKGRWKNGFSIIRPPGHHSGWKDTINGFCVINNIALGARYLQEKYKTAKIAIVDYDIHEGDGTHYIFNQDPNVLFISIHRYDRGSYYPGGQGGNFPCCGKGPAEGTKLNIPLNTRSKQRKNYKFQAPGDNEYIYIYNRIIHPILMQFDPQFILVSSGFDAARKDYLGGFTLTPNAYYYMTKRLLALQKPILCVLEGGYHFLSTAQSVTAVVKGLLNEAQLPEPVKELNFENIGFKCHLEKQYHEDIDEIIEHHSKFWKSLIIEEQIQYTKQIKSNQKKVFGVAVKQQSSSSSSEDEGKDEEQTKAEEAKSTTQTFNKYEEQQIKIQYKNFSYTNDQVLKLINEKQAQFYSSKFPQRVFAPKYYGNKDDYLILNNILFKQKQATIVDIKLSKRSKNLHLTEEERSKQAKREAMSTTEKLSFRIGGITTATSQQDRLLISNEGTVKKILKTVIDDDNKSTIVSFLTNLSQQLITSNRQYYGTSILIIKGKVKTTIHWINFCEWYPHETHDVPLIEGIENLRKTIEQLD